MGAFVPPILTFFSVGRQLGFGTVGGLISFVITLFLSPETKGQVLAVDLQVVPGK